MKRKVPLGKLCKVILSSTKGKLAIIGGLLSLVGVAGDLVSLASTIYPDPQLEVKDDEPNSKSN